MIFREINLFFDFLLALNWRNWMMIFSELFNMKLFKIGQSSGEIILLRIALRYDFERRLKDDKELTSLSIIHYEIRMLLGNEIFFSA
jgi:hypothetical protein